jgi:hypothetical protein
MLIYSYMDLRINARIDDHTLVTLNRFIVTNHMDLIITNYINSLVVGENEY